MVAQIYTQQILITSTLIYYNEVGEHVHIQVFTSVRGFRIIIIQPWLESFGKDSSNKKFQLSHPEFVSVRVAVGLELLKLISSILYTDILKYVFLYRYHTSVIRYNTIKRVVKSYHRNEINIISQNFLMWHLTITIKDFLQMYTIHVHLNGFYEPITLNTQKSYTDVWLKIKKLYFKFHGQQLQLKMVHLDFEKTAHNAVLKVFENCQVVGCRFHSSQAWFRPLCWKNSCVPVDSKIKIENNIFLFMTSSPPYQIPAHATANKPCTRKYNKMPERYEKKM
ncbi:MULE domain-containing protein [Aphis craccivora]|uniref:MULE domain-containing protein n=1 Tax=Aphis craccivora TaxID=307492 RepID=A0A6G0ZNV5_APHCR|nr:MULE domain-containing protein [Aphis craccivora]